MSKSSNQTNWIFSIIGVILVAALLVFVNSIVSNSRVKIDSTEHKVHTLSEGTKNILADLDEELAKYDSDGERSRLNLRLYATYDKDIMPPFLADYAEKVESKLLEFKSYSNDRIELEIIDPEPDSEEEVNANLNGVLPVPIDQNNQVYLGVSVSSLDKNVPVPFLNPQNSPLLEYDIARAIAETVTTKKPTLGLMTSYEMSGGGPGSQPWYLRTQLEREYIVQDIPMSTAKIDSNIDTLLVIHPAGIGDDGQFAIDQYLLGGGRVIAMLDPFSLYNRQAAARPQQIPGMPPPNEPVTSTLGKLLSAWDVQFESVNIVADRRYVNRRRPNPVFLGIPAKGISNETAATQQIDYIEMSFTGAFYGDGASGLTKEVLVSSSEDAGTLSPHTLFGDPATASAALNSMQSSGKPLELVIQLQGKFKTAFPDGLPKDAVAEDAEEGGADADAKDGEGEDAAETASNSLKESVETGTVILIADTDMITDENAAQIARLPGGQALEFPPPNGNLAFISNLVSFLSGNTNLLEVRSRGNNARPFTEYKRLTQEAAKEQQKEYDELVAKRRTAERQYREIRSKQEKGEQVEVAELELVRNYQDERAKTGQRVVELRRELRKGIDSLEARWKWLNIALIPGIVILAAIGHLLYRKFATSAR